VAVVRRGDRRAEERQDGQDWDDRDVLREQDGEDALTGLRT
jgi:hypothetical protein